ncbi:hypothetical protein DV735_g5943, partial [Chaetothyriales sp. CBS 134920]
MSAHLSPALPTNNLRSGAQASKRAKYHNTKWQNGVTTKSTKGCPQKEATPPYLDNCTCGQCPMKPVRHWHHNHGGARAQKLYKKELRGQTSALARKAFRNDVVDAMDSPLTQPGSDTSCSSDDDVSDISAAPLPTGETLMYSYDKKHGPSEGQHVLSNAISAAVARFENTQTEKLVNTEYEVIDGAEDTHVATTDDNHDFELIEHAHVA